MSIETILKENNKMLKELLGKVYGGSMLKKSKKIRDEISELPDMTAGMVPVFKEKRNINNHVKKIRIGKKFYQIGGNNENDSIIESFVEDVEQEEQEEQEEVEDVEEEVEDVEPENTQNNGIKVGGKRPPRILRIMSIKTKKGKWKKNKKASAKKVNKNKKASAKKVNNNKKSDKKKLTKYQQFMKEQIPIYKKKNPKKKHREAFSAVAKLWKSQKRN